MEYKIKITGLDCANCASELEEEISKIKNVKKVSVNYIQQSVKVDCDEDTLIKVKDVCNHFEEVKVVEDAKEYNQSEDTFISRLLNMYDSSNDLDAIERAKRLYDRYIL